MFEHKKLMDLETYGSNNCSTTSMLHKLVYGLIDFDPKLLFELRNRPARRHIFQIKTKNQNRLTSKSFVNRNINKWNLLPKELVLIRDNKHFWKSIIEHITK